MSLRTSNRRAKGRKGKEEENDGGGLGSQSQSLLNPPVAKKGKTSKPGKKLNAIIDNIANKLNIDLDNIDGVSEQSAAHSEEEDDSDKKNKHKRISKYARAKKQEVYVHKKDGHEYKDFRVKEPPPPPPPPNSGDDMYDSDGKLYFFSQFFHLFIKVQNS